MSKRAYICENMTSDFAKVSKTYCDSLCKCRSYKLKLPQGDFNFSTQMQQDMLFLKGLQNLPLWRSKIIWSNIYLRTFMDPKQVSSLL